MVGAGLNKLLYFQKLVPADNTSALQLSDGQPLPNAPIIQQLPGPSAANYGPAEQDLLMEVDSDDEGENPSDEEEEFQSGTTLRAGKESA